MSTEQPIILDDDLHVNSTGEAERVRPAYVLWIPYSILTLTFIIMAVASFLNFHFKNRAMYRARHQEPLSKLRRRTTSKKYHITFGDDGKPYGAKLQEDFMVDYGLDGNWRAIPVPYHGENETYPSGMASAHQQEMTSYQPARETTISSISTNHNTYQNEAFHLSEFEFGIRESPEGSQQKSVSPQSTFDACYHGDINSKITCHTKHGDQHLQSDKGHINYSFLPPSQDDLDQINPNFPNRNLHENEEDNSIKNKSLESDYLKMIEKKYGSPNKTETQVTMATVHADGDAGLAQMGDIKQNQNSDRILLRKNIPAARNDRPVFYSPPAQRTQQYPLITERRSLPNLKTGPTRLPSTDV